MKKRITVVVLLFLSFATSHAQYNSGNSNGQIMTTQSGVLNGASVFTVEFWVRTTENRGNDLYWQRPYFFGNSTNGDNSGDFGITSNYGYVGMYEGVSNLNTDQQFLSTSVRINDDFWHHIAAVNNGQTINLYVDGNIIGSLVSGRRLITTSAPFTFGGATLDFAYTGNVQGNVNFTSQSSFGEARISSIARYNSNFQPQQNFANDGFVVSMFHFGQNNNQNTGYNNNSNQNNGYNTNNNINVNYNPANMNPNEASNI